MPMARARWGTASGHLGGRGVRDQGMAYDANESVRFPEGLLGRPVHREGATALEREIPTLFLAHGLASVVTLVLDEPVDFTRQASGQHEVDSAFDTVPIQHPDLQTEWLDASE